MGMDFTAYFSHSFQKNELDKLTKNLNEEPNQFPIVSQFVEFLLQYNPNDKGKKWRIFPDSFTGMIDISGPCGISLTFSEKVCYFHHYIRWKSFILDSDVQIQLREVCQELKSKLNSPFVIYVPDNAAKESIILDFLWEEKDIFFMKDWLQKNCGLPKSTIREIYKESEDYWESDGYFIDHFKDYSS